MSCHKTTLKTLKEAGYRLTPQRAMILEAIHHLRDHVTADQILAYVEERYPNVDPSTVYRTLDLLIELSIVNTLDVSGRPTEYELGDEPHHHLICRECGGVVTVPADRLDRMFHEVLAAYGFEADMNHLAITGRCATCRTEASVDESRGDTA